MRSRTSARAKLIYMGKTIVQVGCQASDASPVTMIRSYIHINTNTKTEGLVQYEKRRCSETQGHPKGNHGSFRGATGGPTLPRCVADAKRGVEVDRAVIDNDRTCRSTSALRRRTNGPSECNLLPTPELTPPCSLSSGGYLVKCGIHKHSPRSSSDGPEWGVESGSDLNSDLDDEDPTPNPAIATSRTSTVRVRSHRPPHVPVAWVDLSSRWTRSATMRPIAPSKGVIASVSAPAPGD